MTRMRTHRTSKYHSMSNETSQDNNLSFQALGLLTYCLSMPPDWKFYPKVIWKSRRCGRDTCYKMFNELISSYHCIRIKKPNPKSKNLPGEIEYEIFDDIEDCKKRIAELEKTEKFLEHGDNFKKCFRHPAFQDPKAWDPENQDYTKETGNTKETNIQKKQQQAAAVFSQSTEEEQPSGNSGKLKSELKKAELKAEIREAPLSQEKPKVYACLESLEITQESKEGLTRRHLEEKIINAVGLAKSKKTPPRDLAAFIEWAASQGLKPPSKKEDSIDENKKYAENIEKSIICPENIRFDVLNNSVEIVFTSCSKLPICINLDHPEFKIELLQQLKKCGFKTNEDTK